jgi:beta-glucosidase
MVPDKDEVSPTAATALLNDDLVGSAHNTYSNSSHYPSTWSHLISTLSNYTNKNWVNRSFTILLLYGIDTVHGAGFVTGATLFPHQIGIAATVNVSLAQEAARIAAYETRAASIALTFSPVLDLGSDPRWPRLWEDFGEDPYVSAEMGAAMIRGFQGPDPRAIDASHIAACAKHYLGYGSPMSGHDRTPAVIPEVYLREYHLPAFQAAVDADVAMVMANSGVVNGVPVHASKFLLTDLLKNELGFGGIVCSDWDDVRNIWARDKVAPSIKEAAFLAFNAGIDIAMTPASVRLNEHLIELVGEGRLPIGRINDAVRRVLRVKARLGLFKTPVTRPEDYPVFGSLGHRAESYNAAAESITLLKNNGKVLPLLPNKRFLVTGPNADSLRTLNFGWTENWQGSSIPQFLTGFNTILTAINKTVHNSGGSVLYLPGVSYNNSGKYWEEFEVNIGEVVAAIESVDAVILAVGENSYTEKPGDLQDLSISSLQIKLAQNIIEKAKTVSRPVILVINEGRPRLIDRIVDGCNAIVHIFLPGNFGGDALADVIFGRINPSGRLPYTYPRSRHSLVPYWHKLCERQNGSPAATNYDADYNPLWEFGFGLSYTTFAYSALALSATRFKGKEVLRINVTVANTGNRSAKEAVLLFTTDIFASMAPDVRRLRRFRKVELAAGEANVVEFELAAGDLSFVNWDHKRVTEPGEFAVHIGPLSQSFFYG